MRFEIIHYFNVTETDISNAYLHPELYTYMSRNMTKIISIELLDFKESEDKFERKVRYRPKPIIERIGPKRVNPEWMVWVEESRYFKKERYGEFKNIPTNEKIAKVMTNSGTIFFEEIGKGRLRRVIKGVLEIKFPILGRIAEQIIYQKAKEILEEEAKVFSDFIEEKVKKD